MDKENKSCIRLFADETQIERCKEIVEVAANDLNILSRILHLMGSEARLKILLLLKIERELCPCDLSDILGMSVPAISQHLRKLKDADLIQNRKNGQTIYYALKAKHSLVIGTILAQLPINEKIVQL